MQIYRWVLAVAVGLSGQALAQDAPPPRADAAVEMAADDSAAPLDADTLDDDALDSETLDDLVAPIALYPDSLLAQILVAATVPIDLVKADRFIDDNPDLSDADRANQAAQEDWDESVQVLTGGFPTIVDRMADELDWTEELGDAMLAQTDDLLDALQRMRAQAEAAGNLSSNEAQVVETEGDTISIAPADPEVVYVPSYDPVAAYAPLAPGTTYTPSGVSNGNLITTGAIAFGSALLIDEIFDDDDDWDDYWRGPRHIDWDDDVVYPRRGGINTGDVDIDIDRNRVRVGDRDRPIGDRTNVRIGDHERPSGNRDGAWKPDPKQRDAAREKLADRQGGKPGGAGQKLKAGNKAGNSDAARAKLHSAAAERKARPAAKAPPKKSALKPGAGSDHKAQAARTRGAQSLKSNRSPTAQKARASGAKHATAVSRPKAKAVKAPPRKAAAKPSSFKRPQGGAKKAHAASKRGGKHKAKARRR
jgi:hypothetical protein